MQARVVHICDDGDADGAGGGAELAAAAGVVLPVLAHPASVAAVMSADAIKAVLRMVVFLSPRGTDGCALPE